MITQASPRASEVLVIVAATAKGGRLSSLPLCLRREPVSDPANRSATERISKSHLEFAYRGTYVEVSDLGSSNGTRIDGVALDPLKPYRLSAPAELDVAGSLRLRVEVVPRPDRSQWIDAPSDARIGADAPGNVSFVRITRMDNFPERSYVLLYHSGSISTDESALIRISDLARPSRTRGLDFGASTAETIAADLVVREGGLWIAPRTGDLCIDGQQVTAPGQPLRPDHAITIGGNELTFRTIPSHDGAMPPKI
ncbi:MAG: FHA domain-containing protein [Gemmatimonadales bacterium]